MSAAIIRTTSSPEVIAALMQKIGHAVDGAPVSELVVACIGLAMLAQADLTAEQLITGVSGATEWISLYISTITDPPTTPEQVN